MARHIASPLVSVMAKPTRQRTHRATNRPFWLRRYQKPSTAVAQGGGSQIVSPVIVIAPCHKPILRQEPCVHTPKGAKLAAASSRLLAIPIPLRQRLGLLQRRFAGEGRAKLGKGPNVVSLAWLQCLRTLRHQQQWCSGRWLLMPLHWTCCRPVSALGPIFARRRYL